MVCRREEKYKISTAPCVFFAPAGRMLARHVGAGDATLSFDIRILIVVNLKKPMKSDELARFIENG